MFEKSKWGIIQDDFPLFVENCSIQSLGNMQSCDKVRVRGMTISGLTIFHYTILYRRPSYVEYCLSEGYDVNKPLSDEWSPLMLAVFLEYSEIVEILVFYGANINATNRYGASALSLAIQQKNEEMVKILLKTRQTIKDLVNPLHAAVAVDAPNIAALLVQAGADPNAKCSVGKTAIESTKPEQKEMMKVLKSKEKQQTDDAAIFSEFSPDSMTLNELLEMVEIKPDPPKTPFYPPQYI